MFICTSCVCYSKCIEVRGQLLRVLSSLGVGFRGQRVIWLCWQMLYLFSPLTSMLCAHLVKIKSAAFEVRVNICLYYINSVTLFLFIHS